VLNVPSNDRFTALKPKTSGILHSKIIDEEFSEAFFTVTSVPTIPCISGTEALTLDSLEAFGTIVNLLLLWWLL
jgi:hypothetical protein